jgi:hypothetical protein
VTDCEAEGLEGVQSALGEYELDADNPARQNVYFTGIRIEPSSSDPAALRAWVALLRDSNPTMARPCVARAAVANANERPLWAGGECGACAERWAIQLYSS